MAAKFIPTPENPKIGTWHPHFDQHGRAIKAYFVPYDPICPECEGLNGGHEKVSRRRRRR